MSDEFIAMLKAAIQQHWDAVLKYRNEKVDRYIGKFFDTKRLESRISGQVHGNHGTYTVTIQIKDQVFMSACSCYIGKHGNCHHCIALALTLLKDVSAFAPVKTRSLVEVQKLETLKEYLDGVTLESLLQELKLKGITQKDFAASMGMSPRHLSAIRSSELRNHFHNELGATKLACLWVREHFENGTFKKTPSKRIRPNAKTEQE